MSKIAKRIVAGASAMILAFGNMAMTAGAASGTGKVDGIPVKYSTSITETWSRSTSSFQEDPTRYDFKLELGIAYQHRNQQTGYVTTTLAEPVEASGGGISHQINAPTNCTMVLASTKHTFWVNDGIGTVFNSKAEY